MQNLFAPKLAKLGIILCLTLALGGCADLDTSSLKESSVAYTSAMNHLPPIRPGYARIFFYNIRPPMLMPLGIGMKASVDGQSAAALASFQVTYVDRPAGEVKLTGGSIGVWPASPPVDLTLNLVPGETRYVQLSTDSAASTVLVRLIIMEPSQALPDVKECHFLEPQP